MEFLKEPPFETSRSHIWKTKFSKKHMQTIQPEWSDMQQICAVPVPQLFADLVVT